MMSFARLLIFILSIFVATAASAQENVQKRQQETAIFAGGCFWCMQTAFAQLSGVTKVESGYTGGTVANPTYEQVSAGGTGHIEAIRVLYDPTQVAYTKLLEWFWDNVDPNDSTGQFCDKGDQYLAGIFYANDTQKDLAEKSIAAIEKKLNKKVATFLRPTETFYVAEDYHQDYYKKNPIRYKFYKTSCGRDQTLEKIRKDMR